MCAKREEFRHALRMVALGRQAVEVNYGYLMGSVTAWEPARDELDRFELRHLNNPNCVRERQPDYWEPKHVFHCLQFRRKAWAEGAFCFPVGVDNDGVWLGIDGSLCHMSFRELSEHWMFNSPGEPQWRPCVRENAPGL